MSTNAQRFPTGRSNHEQSHFKTSHHFRHQHEKISLFTGNGNYNGNGLDQEDHEDHEDHEDREDHGLAVVTNKSNSKKELLYFNGNNDGYDTIISNSKKREIKSQMEMSKEAEKSKPEVSPQTDGADNSLSKKICESSTVSELTAAISELVEVAKKFLALKE